MTDHERRSRGKSPSGSATEVPREAPADQCCISLNDSMKQLWIGLANNDQNSVEYFRLSPEDKRTFDAARKKLMGFSTLRLIAYSLLKSHSPFEENTRIASCRQDGSTDGNLQMKEVIWQSPE